ncbi:MULTISPECIES: SAVED domain-containing protein [unclassified Microbacterium]|uniref:SAVED domain-containing protein n=1 Tax=unclassified Microbacterium TaxID=2609290 RepID=UPI001603BAD7|nr:MULTISPECIES: SAVED domain-containing protein [unclassified Microbacterium]MBT2485919.1 SAVED domain-containing protein [Microbacterium sp. ISL-108]
MTDFATVTETAVVRVTSRVRNTLSPATDRQIGAALHLEDLSPAGEHPRDAEFVVTIDANDSDPWVWTEGTQKIEKQIADLRDSPYDTVAVFAMAPVPLLVFLGSKLDDKADIRVFPRFRDAEDLACCWRNEPETPSAFEVASSGASPTATDIVITVSVSGVVEVERGPAGLTDMPRVSLVAEHPSPDAIQTKADLASFAKAWRSALAQVEINFPRCERMHLLAAVPIAAAIACGQHHMRDAQPPLIVYQRADEAYTEAITVR